MKSNGYRAEIDRAQQLIHNLRGTGDLPPASAKTLSATYRELDVALENLEQVNEELTEQNIQLAAARKRAEEDRRRYHELFELAPDAYVVTDLEGIIEDANRAASIKLNMSPDSVVGTPLTAFVGQDDASTVLAHLGRFQRGEIERVHGWQLELIPHGRSPATIGLTVELARGPAGERRGLRWLLWDVTERKQMGEKMHRWSSIQAMLSATSLDLIAPHDIATLLETIVERVTDLVSGTDGYVYLSEDTEGELRCVAEHHSAQDSAPNPTANGERPMGTVVATDKAIATKHGHRGWLPTLEGGAEQGDRTSVVAPLISMDRAIGAIRVSRDADNPFSEDDAELLNHFANHAALAIGYHRLLESEREQRQFTETLREVASVLNNTLNRESVLQHILGQLGRVIDFSSASVMLISDGKLDLVAHRGARAGNQPFTPMPIEAFSHIQEAIDTRRPVTIPDTAVDPRWQDRASSVFIRSWLGVPLVVQDRVIGLLNIGKEEPQFYGEEEGQVAAAFADHAAIAIENARLYTETEQQAVDLETNLELARIASSTLELEEVLVLISEHMVRALQVHGCTVSRWDPETGTAISWLERNDRPPAAGEPREVYTVGDLDMICTLGERRQPVTVQIGDLDPESTWVQRWKARGTISGLILPLVAGNSIIGFIELEANGPRCFGRRELDLAEALAAGAAVAIQNAQLYEDVRVGRERLQSLSQQLVEVQEAERRHIARELHDEVSQVLTALKLMLETSRRLPTEGARVKLEQADNLITELIRQVREMSLDLRPPMLDDAGLLPTLLWYFKRYTAHTEVEVRFHHEGLDQPLPEAVATAAYRIVQEALTNVARHADVDEVAVEVRADGNVLTLRVEDRGIGFDYHGVRAKRSTGGLQGFYERAALLGGRATVISAPGAGAVLSAELPIAPPGLAEEHRDA